MSPGDDKDSVSPWILQRNMSMSTDSQVNDYCDDVESDEERLYLNNWSVVMFIIPRCDQFSASYNIQVFLFPSLAL